MLVYCVIVASVLSRANGYCQFAICIRVMVLMVQIVLRASGIIYLVSYDDYRMSDSSLNVLPLIIRAGWICCAAGYIYSKSGAGKY